MRSRTIVCLLILTLLILLMFWRNRYNYATNDTYYRVSDDLAYHGESLTPPTLVLNVLTRSNIARAAHYNRATYLMFETYGDIDTILKKLRYPIGVKYVAGIQGSDLLAGKDRLAKYLKHTKWIPDTYILYTKESVSDFKQRFDPKEVYIAKKNIQRQNGLLLFNDLNDFTSIESEYVIVQKMLQNPFTIGGRKINIRIYMLVYIHGSAQLDQIEMHAYPGFVYYTPDKFVMNSLNQNECITTGYIDRNVYVSNPLTVEDLEPVIGSKKYSKLMAETYKMLSDVCRIYSPVLLQLHSDQRKRNRKIKHFSIFGCDVAIDKSLGVKLMEINKGPSIDPHDARDSELKLRMVQGAHQIVGLSRNRGPLEKTGWVKLG